MNCISFRRIEGSYNICNPNQKQVQYIFDFGKFCDLANEKNLKRGFVISDEEDYGYKFPDYTALDLANELKDIICGHWIDTDKEKIIAVYDFISELENKNWIEMCRDMIEKCDKMANEYNDEANEWRNKLEAAEEGIESN